MPEFDSLFDAADLRGASGQDSSPWDTLMRAQASATPVSVRVVGPLTRGPREGEWGWPVEALRIAGWLDAALAPRVLSTYVWDGTPVVWTAWVSRVDRTAGTVSFITFSPNTGPIA